MQPNLFPNTLEQMTLTEALSAGKTSSLLKKLSSRRPLQDKRKKGTGDHFWNEHDERKPEKTLKKSMADYLTFEQEGLIITTK